jgi:hypothetical protein
VSADLWRKWLPALVQAGKHQEVADLALLGVLGRPGADAMAPLLEFRANALLALRTPGGQDALAAAKSYYNACDLKLTAKAVDLVALAIARAHPEDLEAARRFKAEQAAAAAGGGSSGQNAVAGGQTGEGGGSILGGVVIDAGPYAAALAKWAGKTKFNDRASYANLLLAADKGKEAEAAYRELFQLAATQDELAVAAEGIAKALRAQDGNVGRANAWLVAFQRHAATQPALPAAAAKPAAGAKPAEGAMP